MCGLGVLCKAILTMSALQAPLQGDLKRHLSACMSTKALVPTSHPPFKLILFLVLWPKCAACRSVQTAFSLAESIGYSTEFVLPAEEQVQEKHKEAISEGVTMATILCWTTAITLLVAGSCYLVHSMVA